MKALRIHVERIVRPIRASVLRKNKMREELLAHLSSAYEEERAASNTGEEALVRAKQRLGDPDALRAELQSAVPWYERIGHTRVPIRLEMVDYGLSRKYGWRASARFATEIIGCLIFSAPLLFALAYFVTLRAGLNRPPHASFADCLLTIAVMMAMLWLSLFVAFWLFDLIGARRRVAPWNCTPAIIKACLTNLLWMFAIGLFLVLFTRFMDYMQPHEGLDSTGSILLAALAGIPYAPWLGLALLLSLLSTMSIAMHFERRQYEAWGCLDVEE
ncbi:MAG: hypothetical protein IT365_24065 [Candidatus Hydrogenedentes bacterium]|nr:hypothetical protein [Candidatus Hydrogenedentota bacterium]